MKKLILLIILNNIIFASSPQHTVSFVCYECHGKKMNINSMNVGQPPNSLSQSEILTALRGYKNEINNKYGSGDIMTEVVSDYKDSELKSLSKYIPTLY